MESLPQSGITRYPVRQSGTRHDLGAHLNSELAARLVRPTGGITIASRYYMLPPDSLSVPSDSISNLKPCYRCHANSSSAISSRAFLSLHNRRRDSIPIGSLRHRPCRRFRPTRFSPTGADQPATLTHRSRPRRRAKNALRWAKNALRSVPLSDMLPSDVSTLGSHGVGYNPPPHKCSKGTEPIEQGSIVAPYRFSRECRRGINGRLTSFQGRLL